RPRTGEGTGRRFLADHRAAQDVPQPPQAPGETGLDRAQRDPAATRDLPEAQLFIEAEGEHLLVLGGEPPEGLHHPIPLGPIGHELPRIGRPGNRLPPRRTGLVLVLAAVPPARIPAQVTGVCGLPMTDGTLRTELYP